MQDEIGVPETRRISLTQRSVLVVLLIKKNEEEEEQSIDVLLPIL